MPFFPGVREGVKKEWEGGRGRAAYLAMRISGYTVKEIADHFRGISFTVSEAIKRVDDLLRKDKRLKGKRKYRITEA